MHNSLRLRHSLFAVLLLTCIGHGQQPKKPPVKIKSSKAALAPSTKFFALEIGSAFTLPECQKAPAPLTYIPGEMRWCWKDPSGFPKSGAPAPEPVNEDLLIHYSPDDAPVYSISSGLSVKVENGKVQRITFHTNGLRAINEVIEAFSTMYGKPTRVDPVKVENNVGDEFQSRNALWLYSNLAVDYRGVDTDLSLGTVWIETPSAYKARTESEKKKVDEKGK